jgi:hypothetical protein
MSGWVKFHRKIEEWEWYKDANTFRLFFHLVMKANHKDGRWQGVEIKRGQLVTSLDHLSEDLKLSVQQIRTALTKLKSTNEITIKTTNRFTLVTVENYSVYQSQEEESTSKLTSNITDEQQTDNKQITTNKNVKKEKKVISKDVEHFSYKPLNDVMIDFIEHRKQIKKVMTDKAIKMMVDKVNKFDCSEDEKVKALENSIINGWQGVFEPPKSNVHQKQSSQLKGALGSPNPTKRVAEW